jgi:hypothetical protein
MPMSRVTPSQVVAVIEKFFRSMELDYTRKITHAHSSALFAVLQLLEEVPPELLPTGDDYSKFVVAVSAIRDRLQKWSAQIETGYPMPDVQEFGGNPVLMVRDILARCPDQIRPAAASGLEFITDSDLRNSLRQDLSPIRVALANREWKGTTVLGGSLCEALLLWKLQQTDPTIISSASTSLVTAGVFRRPLPQNLEEWGLYQYAEVCGHLKLIESETLAQVRLAKDFRNLIHPGRAIRLGQKCDAGTAHAAVAAVEFIVRDFTT